MYPAEVNCQNEYVAQIKIPHVTVLFQGEVQDMAPEPIPNAPRRLTIRLNGRVQAVVPIPTTAEPGARDSEDPGASEDDADISVVSDHLEDTPDELDLIEEVDRLLNLDANAQDSEDGPDWMFDKEEVTEKNPDYVFCLAVHRQQILHLFTKHFCQHPIFPERHGSLTAAEIRRNAVKEMHDFCKRRGLREVWGYMWACWYTPKMWKVWARSTSPYLSRLRTTMAVENFWRQLKHNYFHNHARPRLDHLVWIMIHEVTPDYFARMDGLQDTYRLGRSKALTTYQRRFKFSWAKIKDKVINNESYETNVATWTCNCGSQKYNSHHLCKHLVRAVGMPEASFWRNIIRRRVSPIYRHPLLVAEAERGNSEGYFEPDGAITDGDDNAWSGDPSVLQGEGGWKDLVSNANTKRPHGVARTNSESARDKWPRIIELHTNSENEVIDLTMTSPIVSPRLPQTALPSADDERPPSELGFRSDSSAFDYGSDDEVQVS